MKAFFFVSAVLVGVAGIGTHADAQNYPGAPMRRYQECAKTADSAYYGHALVVGGAIRNTFLLGVLSRVISSGGIFIGTR
jgi:hypothetical protein